MDQAKATVDQQRHHKIRKVAQLIRHRGPSTIERLLVVGCGTGEEAAVLARSLDCEVTGIDLTTHFDPEAEATTTLQFGDATALSFEDESFDFVYSYHVLEHIPDYRSALAEIRRVLRPAGGFWIGTPNRSRWVGYLGSKTPQATPMNKSRWNLQDWKARLQGRFRNELGAHAGFTARELEHELSEVFGKVEDASLDYFATVYARRAVTVRLLHALGLGNVLFPSVYFVGAK